MLCYNKRFALFVKQLCFGFENWILFISIPELHSVFSKTSNMRYRLCSVYIFVQLYKKNANICKVYKSTFLFITEVKMYNYNVMLMQIKRQLIWFQLSVAFIHISKINVS